MFRRLFLNFVVLFTLLSASAADKFLPADCTALIELLPPPPANDSVLGRAELETVLKVQADRTAEQVHRAKRVANQTVTSFARPVLGDWFQAQDFPRTLAIFEEIGRESRKIIDDQVKKRWNRARPYLRSSAVQPVVGRPDNTSYPSGHSADSALYAVILAVVVPEHAADWQEQARLVRWSRIIGGAHYPSDTVAGQLLGEAIAREMLKSPALQAALLEVRAELAAQLLKKAA